MELKMKFGNWELEVVEHGSGQALVVKNTTNDSDGMTLRLVDVSNGWVDLKNNSMEHFTKTLYPTHVDIQDYSLPEETVEDPTLFLNEQELDSEIEDLKEQEYERMREIDREEQRAQKDYCESLAERYEREGTLRHNYPEEY